MGTLHCEAVAKEELPKPLQKGASGFPRWNGLLAYLRFKGSLGMCLCTLAYHGNVLLIVYQLSTLPSQQHLASLFCSCSTKKVAVSRNLSLQEAAQGP